VLLIAKRKQKSKHNKRGKVDGKVVEVVSEPVFRPLHITTPVKTTTKKQQKNNLYFLLLEGYII
jgi:hypothetical protein